MYKNEDLAECSIWARYIWPGLWTLADREGRLEDRPKRIKGELLPFDSQDVEPLLRELEARLFILRYKNSDGSFIQILKFSKHQTPHYTEKASVIKPPTLQENAGDISKPDSGSSPSIKATSPPDDSKKQPFIKGGPLPPDSLIHRFTDSPNPEKGKSAPQGSRLAPEWVLPDDWKAWAMKAEGWDEARTLDVAERFRLHWLAKAGKDARKVDWSATWQGWVRRQKDFTPKGNGHDHAAPLKATCAKCKTPITGSWTQTDDGRVHDRCWNG